MNNQIHQSAKIGKDTIVGYYTVIEEGVKIGNNCRIGHHVVIHKDTVIGDNVRIDAQSVIGKTPMKSVLSALTKEKELPPAQIGNGVLVGASAIIYRGCKISDNVMVADFASIREDVTIGETTIIGRGVTVENRTSIGKRCKIETETYICAISAIGDGCFIAPEVTFTNDNFLGRTKERFKYHKGVTMLKGARIGANSTVLPGITIGEDGLVAAGSVVTKDVPAKTLVMGTPAKSVRPVPSEQLLENQ
ncbi:MAG: N-acetyltransferase [Planctomycetes bacterium]|nr:N-acetyltransferase [Planctomycetota bacterium]